MKEGENKDIPTTSAFHLQLQVLYERPTHHRGVRTLKSWPCMINKKQIDDELK